MTSIDRLRLGLTMRGAPAPDYVEPRDALAQDWHGFLAVALPEAQWLPIPNLGGEAAVRYFQAWGLNALLLTGGEDLGDNPQRDASEVALLTHALSHGLPVLGICRGLQLLWTHLGGRLSPVSRHRATRHIIHGLEGHQTVNSFHAQGLIPDPLPPLLEVLALAEDGSIEALRLRGKPVLGLMWHPEREPLPSERDVTLLRSLFTQVPE
jgi:putative glutamine amidotransferase